MGIKMVREKEKEKEIGMEIELLPLEDDAFAFEVYASTRADELAAWGWPEEVRGQFLHMQYTSQNMSYTSAYPDLNKQIITADGSRAGRLYVWSEEGRLVLVDLALLPAFRNRGLGTFVIRSLQDQAAAARQTIELHVRKGNPAQRLYIREGFQVVEENELDYHMHWKCEL